MALTSVSSVNAYFTGLINQLMTIESRPVQALATQKTGLNSKQSVFSSLSTKLSTVQTIVNDLDSTATTSVFDSRKATVSGVTSGKTVLSASVSSGAIAGTYSLSVTTLAREHRVRSDQQTYSDQALGLTGTFIIGGAAARSQATVATISDTVTAFDTASIGTGQTEIGTGTYYVETRNDATAGWQFRVVDSDGKAVAIDDAVDTGTATTSNWQAIASGGGSFDTLRGLKITFGSDSGLYQAGNRSASTAAQVTYTAQGASITVASTDTLSTIASTINAATFASGDKVSATVVDRQLVLTTADTGAANTVVASDSSGTVLETLGVLTGGGAFKNVMQTALDAAFTVNGLTITRSKNTGIDDVATGVTFDLAADSAGETATLSVAQDTLVIRGKVNALLLQTSALLDYIKEKSSITFTDDTLTRGVLADDSAYNFLRTNLVTDMMSQVTGLAAGAPSRLSEIGITLNDDLQFVMTDINEFDTAIANDTAGVKALLAAVTDRVDTRLDQFTDSTSGIVTVNQKSITSQIEDIDDRVKTLNEQLAQRRIALTEQYSLLQNQILNNIYTQEQFAAFNGGGFSVFG